MVKRILRHLNMTRWDVMMCAIHYLDDGTGVNCPQLSRALDAGGADAEVRGMVLYAAALIVKKTKSWYLTTGAKEPRKYLTCSGPKGAYRYRLAPAGAVLMTDALRRVARD